MKPKMSIVVQNFIMVLICLTTCDSASWLQQNAASQIFEIGDEIDINCNLTDPTINVTLWKSPDHVNYRQVMPKVGRIQQFNQMFRLINVGQTDKGEYQCRAANMTSFNVLEVYLSHHAVPRPMPKITEMNKAEYGKNVTLRCSAPGNLFTLTWYKRISNGTINRWQLMNSGKQNTNFARLETSRHLIIKKFNISDNGVYKCILKRHYVKWKSSVEKYVGIEDLHAPNFTKFLEPLVTVNEGDYFERNYEVTGSPKPVITWYKMYGEKEELLSTCDGDEHSQCSNQHGNSNLYIYNNEFFMSPSTFPKDSTMYKCVASNILGNAAKVFRLNVLAKPKIAKSNEREVDLVHVYDESPEPKLVCKVKSANPKQISFSWEVQLSGCTNADCKPNNSNWQSITGTEIGFQISKDGSTLTTKTRDQHFFYRCTAKNSIGSDSRVWNVVLVKEIRPLKAVQRLVEVDEGENAKLSCQVSRFTSTLIRWSYKNEFVELGSRMTVVNSSSNDTIYNTLHIREVNVTDSGKYKCFGEFKGAALTAEIQLKVRESEAPKVSLKNITTTQSSSFFIRCNVTGHPEPKITWKRNGELVKISDSVKGIRDCGNRVTGYYITDVEKRDHATVLVICKADYKYSGRFSCTARNKLGNDTAKASIDILAPPTISEFKNNQEIELGQRFFLQCLASGYPKPQVWWEKKDKETSKFTRLENARNDELRFDQLEESDLGIYRCIAQNENDETDTRNFTIALSPVIGRSNAGAPTNMSNKYPIVIGCVSFFIVAIVIIVAVILYKRKKAYGGFYILTLPPLPDYIKKLDPHTPLTEQTNKLPYDAEWEFPRNRLKFSRELGSGAFGKVFLADALGIVAFDPRGSTKKRSSRRRFGGSVRRNHYVNNNKMTKVAVKTLKEDSGETEYKDLLSELKILIHVGEHKNIVNLLGACTKGRESELWVIIEFCSNGNLLQFLRNRRDIYETEWKGVSKDPNVQLTMTDLVIVAYQVARGMEFLASRLCIHRDLATRNILVTDNYVIKIADFGLARDVGEDSQYVKTSTGLLPVKWMAIEAIIQRLFTEKSDVWSFGIVLWELFTLGGTPYPNISPNEVAEFLARGHRMEAPHACPDEISTLMMKCWQEDKDCRPTFKELVEILDKIIELHTSSEGGCGYLEVQGEVMNEYLSPSDVKTPEMDPFECNSPLPPIPSPGDNENDSLLLKDQNARRGKFRFDKAIGNKGRNDSEVEKMQNDHVPEIMKAPDVKCLRGRELDGYIDTSLTGKEKERIDLRDLDKDRDSSEEPQPVSDYAYWKKSMV